MTVLREAVVAERARTAGQVAALSRDFDSIVAASEQVSTDDEHDPEGATIAYERAQVSALLEHARQRLADLDGALGRLDDPAFGRCRGCGGPIPPERLVALPATRTCVDCAARGVR